MCCVFCFKKVVVHQLDVCVCADFFFINKVFLEEERLCLYIFCLDSRRYLLFGCFCLGRG